MSFSDRQLDIDDPESLIRLIKKHHHWLTNDTLQKNLENTIKCMSWNQNKSGRYGYNIDYWIESYKESCRVAWAQVKKLRARYEQRRQKYADLNSKHNKLKAELEKYKKAFGELPMRR